MELPQEGDFFGRADAGGIRAESAALTQLSRPLGSEAEDFVPGGHQIMPVLVG